MRNLASLHRGRCIGLQRRTVDFLPDTAEQDHSQGEHDPGTLMLPPHPRRLQSLREHGLTGSFGDPAADRQMPPPILPILHVLGPLPQIRIGSVVISPPMRDDSMTAPPCRGRVQHATWTVGLQRQLRHPPGPAFRGPVLAKQGFGQNRNPLAGMIVIDHQRDYTPGKHIISSGGPSKQPFSEQTIVPFRRGCRISETPEGVDSGPRTGAPTGKPRAALLTWGVLLRGRV